MLSYQPYREAGHSQTYRTACNFIQTLTPNPATVSEDASGLVCIKVGGIFFSSASRKVMAYPTDCARFPWQVDSGKGHLTCFRGKTVSGGQHEMLPGTLSWGYRARWKAGRCHLEHFRGKTVTGGRRERTPDMLSRENRVRWKAGRCHLEHFRGKTVAGVYPICRDILWRSAGPSRNAGPFPSREPMPASAIVCSCHLA